MVYAQTLLLVCVGAGGWGGRWGKLDTVTGKHGLFHDDAAQTTKEPRVGCGLGEHLLNQRQAPRTCACPDRLPWPPHSALPPRAAAAFLAKALQPVFPASWPCLYNWGVCVFKNKSHRSFPKLQSPQTPSPYGAVFKGTHTGFAVTSAS